MRFADEDELVLTYVCNVRSLPDEDPNIALRTLSTQMDIYHPQTVRIPRPLIGSPNEPAD